MIKTFKYEVTITGWKAWAILGLAMVGVVESVLQIVTIALLPLTLPALHSLVK